MSKYEYRDDFERKLTDEYENLYSPEEVELNKKLYQECSKEVINFEAVETLLKQGADPLGPTEAYGWEVLEHIYGEIVSESQFNNSIYLPRLTELFLKYGMDVDTPRVPYDGGDSINPLWNLGLVTNENATFAFEMLLNKGISIESFGEFWSTAIGDLLDVSCGDPVNDDFWNYECTWTLKMLMLAASYDYILNGDEYLKKFIGCSYNDYDIHNFRNWNRYSYEFDTSHCERYPELYQSVVTISEIESGKEVWKIGVCLNEGEF